MLSNTSLITSGARNEVSENKPVPDASGAPKELKPLTRKQQQFVNEYLADGNATRAFMRAFGKKYNTANSLVRTMASKLKARTNVRAHIEARTKAEGLEISHLVGKLQSMTSFDIRDVVEWGANGYQLRDSKDIPPEVALCIDEIKVTVDRDGNQIINVKMTDKQAAIDKLLKVQGAYTQKVEHSGPNGSELPTVTVILDRPSE